MSLSRFHILLAAGLILGPATAQQNMTIDVAKQYGVTYADASKRIGDKYRSGEDTIALKYAWARAKYERMPHAQFRRMYLGWGLLKDVAFFNEATGVLASGNQNTFVFADWTGAKGKWLVNGTAQLPRAGMKGASSFVYAGNGADHGQHATEFVMADSEWWPAEARERRMLETAFANEHGVLAYNESFTLENFRLSGPHKDDGILRIGLLISRGGECSYLNQVRADGFSIGIGARGGVPLTVGTVSAFQNSTAGFATLGGALGTYNIATLSGDGNKHLLAMLRYNGEEAGGRMVVGLLKYEDGTTPGLPHGNGSALYAEGQFFVDIGLLSFANQGGANPIAAFILDNRLTNGSPQNSYIRAGVIGQGYARLLKNNVTGSTWLSPGDYAAVQFEYYVNADQFTSAIPIRKEGGTPIGPVPIEPEPVEPPVVSPSGIVATTSLPVHAAHEAPSAMVDGKPSTRWTSGRTPSTSDWVTLDLGEGARWKVLTLDAALSPNDHAKELSLLVSDDGVKWTALRNTTYKAVYGPITTITTTTYRSQRYVRLQVVSAPVGWWSIHEVTAQ